jgi:radical SAM protein with 4Fe4S-binding SPASM domain
VRLPRRLFPLYRRLERSAQVLRYLFVEITQRCNLACLHCGSDCSSQPRLDELSVVEWERFFDFLGANADTSRLLLVVTGGEPLCTPQLPRILRSLARNRLTFGMVSNGWALDAAMLGRLVDHGLRSMTISLDGLADTHDWLRGRAGSFERALSAIAAVVNARIPNFDIVTCANPRNLDQLPVLRGLLREVGVPAWRLFSIFPRGRARKNPEVQLSSGQLSRLLAWIAQARLETNTSPSIQWSCEGFLPDAIDQKVRDEPFFCRAGINIGSVLCDGSISACPNIPRSLVQGNIRRDDFFDVWENRFAPFRDRSWMASGDCKGCRDWKRCQGNSLHLLDEEAGGSLLCHRKLPAWTPASTP